MARKLKTYRTSLGFFDQAVAAPSMKAALEAWGADSNLFHQGVATQTDDPEIVAATMEKPGVVLKRPAGSNGRFAEHSDLPFEVGEEGKPSKVARKPASRRPKKSHSRPLNEAAERKAAVAYERERRRRERERAKEEASRRKERERREKSVAKAQAALDEAEREHARRAAAIQSERDALERRAQNEETRWEKERKKLDAAERRPHEN
ncbi:cell envelope biogenesis protein TolA [Bradyrhizobium diazoefficiens]|nr:cell envelope biogenesis protein TolA [Bradyrhizobium diazoefficiens]QQN62206.1 cell envelope biogenesis protein TolA [Bradyrhizobium diazoefficiens]